MEYVIRKTNLRLEPWSARSNTVVWLLLGQLRNLPSNRTTVHTEDSEDALRGENTRRAECVTGLGSTRLSFSLAAVVEVLVVGRHLGGRKVYHVPDMIRTITFKQQKCDVNQSSCEATTKGLSCQLLEHINHFIEQAKDHG